MLLTSCNVVSALATYVKLSKQRPPNISSLSTLINSFQNWFPWGSQYFGTLFYSLSSFLLYSRTLRSPKSLTWFLTILSQIPLLSSSPLTTFKADLWKIPSSSPPHTPALSFTHFSYGIASTAMVLSNTNILMILKSQYKYVSRTTSTSLAA